MRGVEQVPWLYDALLWVVEKLGFGRLRAALAGRARGRSLDLGCGTGRNLEMMTTGSLVVGLDPSRECLVAARRRAPGIPLLQARAEALPFAARSFDTILSGLVFCSVADVPKALDEAARILRPGGTLQMLEHVRSSRPWLGRIQDRIQPIWTRIVGGCHPNRDTETVIERCGFRIRADSRRVAGDVLRLFEAAPLGERRSLVGPEAVDTTNQPT
jgi:ubiquinone/menaquinone biosynthesis C-methylase UbiE